MGVRWVRFALAGAVVPLLSLLFVGPGFALAIPDGDRSRANLDALRIPFVPNQGHVDARVAYYAQTFAGTLFVTRRGDLVYALRGFAPGALRGRPRVVSGPGWTLTETFVGGAIRPAAQDRGATGVSVFLGNDPARWRPALPTYGQLGLGDVWPGVTVALRARGGSIEKVFTVAAGARVDGIRMRVGGAEALAVDAAGALVAGTGLGPVAFSAPVAYQERDGVRREIPVAYRLVGREYRFTVGAYDPSVPLVIDPLLQSTYLGGSGDESASSLISIPRSANAVAVHPATGDVYVAGVTASTDFPGTAGGAQGSAGGFFDVFIARLNAGLTALVQATYLGGSSADLLNALAIDPLTGDVYVAGSTGSDDFPGTGGPGFPGCSCAFVARLNSALTALTGASYVGRQNFGYALAIHPVTRDVYVAGTQVVQLFVGGDKGIRVVPSGFRFDAFVVRLDSALGAILGGSGFGEGGNGAATEASSLAIHPVTGDVYMGGWTDAVHLPGVAGGAQPTFGGGRDAFVMRFSSALAGPITSTYLGGAGADTANALSIHPPTGDLYVAGTTDSADFPGTTGGSQPTLAVDPVTLLPGVDAFAARLSSDLAILRQATYLGGGASDSATALAVHPASGDVYVAGTTTSLDLPGTAGGAQPRGLGLEGFVARLAGNLTALAQATYLGGSGDDEAFALAIHPATSDVYVAGVTSSTDLPGTTGGAQPTGGGGVDAFVSRLTFGLASIDPLFADVFSFAPLRPWIEALARAGITGGCQANPPRYCADAEVTRGQIAVLLLRGLHGAGVQPPAATGIFADVSGAHPFATWIEQLAREGITGGCAASPPRYCPDAPVTRGQMAVLLLRARHGAAYDPPAATGTMFVDVRPNHPLARWIEQLAREGIAGGCEPLRYCPDAPVSRGEMAVFLVRTFGLPL